MGSRSTVADFAEMTPTVVYNCKWMPTLCQNAVAYLGAGNNGPVEFHYDKNGDRLKERRQHACPDGWANVHCLNLVGLPNWYTSNDLMEHVRRNHYTFATAPGASSHGSDTNDTFATGFNSTVTAAAAVVAQSLASGDKTTATVLDKRQSSSYWMADMVQNGASPFAPPGYKVWRNVKDFGAVGDGVTDDTAAINLAISSGGRCGLGCGSSTTLFAVVYFPPGTYLVSSSIIQYYMTQFIGDPVDRPTIKASPAFTGLGMISSDVYIDGGDGAEWYINQV
ncbi:hypothetical protein VTG60DRAFT_4072 [Thermothelomyces hinnuleus]